MTATAEKTDPKLWDTVKARVTKGDKGGEPGQWSARKAQLAVAEYKKAGGGYSGRKTADNHLATWGREDWGTKSGETSGKTGERYLPKAARASLSKDEYAATTAKKRKDKAAGHQFSRQPKAAAAQGAKARLESQTLAVLRQRAAVQGIPGRSSMRKDALIQALSP